MKKVADPAILDSLRKNFVKVRDRATLSRSNQGFSLMELVVAVGLILVLVVGGFIAYGAITHQARVAAVSSVAHEAYTGMIASDAAAIGGTPSEIEASIKADLEDDNIEIEIVSGANEPLRVAAWWTGDGSTSHEDAEIVVYMPSRVPSGEEPETGAMSMGVIWFSPIGPSGRLSCASESIVEDFGSTQVVHRADLGHSHLEWVVVGDNLGGGGITADCFGETMRFELVRQGDDHDYLRSAYPEVFDVYSPEVGETFYIYEAVHVDYISG